MNKRVIEGRVQGACNRQTCCKVPFILTHIYCLSLNLLKALNQVMHTHTLERPLPAWVDGMVKLKRSQMWDFLFKCSLGPMAPWNVCENNICCHGPILFFINEASCKLKKNNVGDKQVDVLCHHSSLDLQLI